jgi:hypothetical protein
VVSASNLLTVVIGLVDCLACRLLNSASTSVRSHQWIHPSPPVLGMSHNIVLMKKLVYFMDRFLISSDLE